MNALHQMPAGRVIQRVIRARERVLIEHAHDVCNDREDRETALEAVRRLTAIRDHIERIASRGRMLTGCTVVLADDGEPLLVIPADEDPVYIVLRSQGIPAELAGLQRMAADWRPRLAVRPGGVA